MSPPKWFQTPKKILFVLHPHIGDVVNLTAATRWMKCAWPESKVVGLTSQIASPLLDACDTVDEVMTRPRTLMEKCRFIRWSRHQRFDLAVFAYPNRSLLRLIRLAGVNRVVGVRDRDSEKWDFSVPSRSGQVKVPGETADLLTALGCSCADFRPEIRSREVDRETAKGFLSKSRSQYVAVHCGASHPNKLWDIRQFGALARWIESQGKTVVFVGGAAEQERVSLILSQNAVDLTGKTSLLETAAALERCAVLISSDSGPVHLAAAVGTPVVVLYGPTRSEDHSPYGDQNVLIQGQCPYSCREVESCFGECWKDISVDKVIEAVSTKLLES